MHSINEMIRIVKVNTENKSQIVKSNSRAEQIYRMLKENYIMSGKSEFRLLKFAIFTGDGWLFDHPESRKIILDHYGSLKSMPHEALLIYCIQDILNYGMPTDDLSAELSKRIKDNNQYKFLYLIAKSYEYLDTFLDKEFEYITKSYAIQPTAKSISRMLDRGIYKKEFNEIFNTLVYNFKEIEYNTMDWLNVDTYIGLHISMNQNSVTLDNIAKNLQN